MKLLRWAYEKKTGKPEPYYFDYSLLTITGKPIRKWVAQCLAPNCVFNNIRILLYRLCGFKIGKHVFIGMKCYLEDMCYDLLTIGNNMTISYGVYFTCHGKNQGHYPITVEDGAYVGMRANIISKNSSGGEYCSWRDYLEKCDSWSMYSSEQGCARRHNSSWNSLPDYREINLREGVAA